MKHPCELIEDILPLYVENDVSNKTQEIVEEHLQECPTCQNLFAELKKTAPVLPNLKESLPEANTLKRSLKRLRLWALAGLILIILAGIGIGVVGYKAGSASQKDILSVNDVTRTLRTTGLTLTPEANLKPADYKIGDKVPSIYKINAGEDIFIYCFSSIGERNTEFNQWEEKHPPLNGTIQNMFTSKGQFNIRYFAKNTMIVYSLSKYPKTAAEFQQKVTAKTSTLAILGKAIFYHLNGGKEIVFQGESKHWKGKIAVYYYQHFWTDDKGTLRYDSWSEEVPSFEFKGDAKSITGDFSYELKSNSGDRLMTDHTGFHPDLLFSNPVNLYGGIPTGIPRFGGSSGAIPQTDDVYTFTAKWNHQQETFELKAVPQS